MTNNQHARDKARTLKVSHNYKYLAVLMMLFATLLIYVKGVNVWKQQIFNWAQRPFTVKCIHILYGFMLTKAKSLSSNKVGYLALQSYMLLQFMHH